MQHLPLPHVSRRKPLFKHGSLPMRCAGKRPSVLQTQASRTTCHFPGRVYRMRCGACQINARTTTGAADCREHVPSSLPPSLQAVPSSQRRGWQCCWLTQPEEPEATPPTLTPSRSVSPLPGQDLGSVPSQVTCCVFRLPCSSARQISVQRPGSGCRSSPAALAGAQYAARCHGDGRPSRNSAADAGGHKAGLQTADRYSRV